MQTVYLKDGTSIENVTIVNFGKSDALILHGSGEVEVSIQDIDYIK